MCLLSGVLQLLVPGGDPIPAEFEAVPVWTAVSPDTFACTVTFLRSAIGQYRVSFPAAGIVQTVQGQTEPVLVLDLDACEGASAANQPPLQFLVQLRADCDPPARAAPFLTTDTFFRRHLPRMFAGESKFPSFTPRYVADIVGQSVLI